MSIFETPRIDLCGKIGIIACRLRRLQGLNNRTEATFWKTLDQRGLHRLDESKASADDDLKLFVAHRLPFAFFFGSKNSSTSSSVSE